MARLNFDVADVRRRITAEATEDAEERAAIMQHEAGLPEDWALALARLALSLPTGPEAPTWRAALDRLLTFADRHAAAARRLGWTVEELFGTGPLVNAQKRGAAVRAALAGEVIAISAGSLVVRDIECGEINILRV